MCNTIAVLVELEDTMLKALALLLVIVAVNGNKQPIDRIIQLLCLTADFKVIRKGDKFTTEMVEQLGYQVFLYEKQYKEATLEDVCRQMSAKFNQRFGIQWNCVLFFGYMSNGYGGWWLDHEPDYYIAIEVYFRREGHTLVMLRAKPQGGLNSTVVEE